jgi:hypothetical protein
MSPRIHPFFVRIWKSFDDGDDACWFAGLDTGVKCLQRHDAWSVHTKGFRRPCVIGPR